MAVVYRLRWALVVLLALPSLLAGQGESLFWKGKSEGKTIYLMGSIHVGKQEWYPLDPRIEEAFRECERLAVELDIAAIDPAGLRDDIHELARLPEDETLYDILPTDVFFALDDQLYDYQINLIDYNDTEPWFFIWMLSGLQLMGGEYDTERGIDLYFLRKAHDREKPVIALETVDEQIAAFSGLGRENAIELLRGSLKQQESAAEQLDNLVAAWESGDEERLLGLLRPEETTEEASSAFEESLLTRRNLRMAEGIERAMESGECLFVVVGALHVIGDDGLVALLEKRGYDFQKLVPAEAGSVLEEAPK